MKKILFLIALLYCSDSLYAQWRLSDYEQKELVTIDSVTYKIEAPFIGLVNWETKPNKETAFLMTSISNKYDDVIGQYKDGTFAENPSDVHGIIIPKEYYKNTIYHAVRAAFSKETDLIPYHHWTIYVFIIVDSQGNILETSTGFPSTKNHVIQPGQIARLESLIRKNLKFELSSKAKNFNYFEGQIIIPFHRYIEDMPEGKLGEDAKKVGEEESSGGIPAFGGGSLPSGSQIGNGN